MNDFHLHTALGESVHCNKILNSFDKDLRNAVSNHIYRIKPSLRFWHLFV